MTLSWIHISRNLKTILLLLAFYLAFPVAQAEQNLSFGPKTGLNFSKLRGDTTNNEFGFGYTIGAALLFQFDPKFSINTDLLFSRLNFANTGTSSKVWHFQVPVQLRAHLAPEFFLQGGANLAFGFGEVTTDDGLVEQTLSYEQAARSKFDYSLMAGLGSEFFFDNGGSLTIEGRFNWGLNDLYQEESLSIYSYGFEVVTGYFF